MRKIPKEEFDGMGFHGRGRSPAPQDLQSLVFKT